VLLPLLEAGETSDAAPETRLFAAMAAATAASVHRGLGRHPQAFELDERGMGLADGRAEAVFDCTLGVASDAVGMNDLANAQTALATAESLVAAHDDSWWRQRVRLGWTRAEVALLADEPSDAAIAAAASVEGAERARAPRHV